MTPALAPVDMESGSAPVPVLMVADRERRRLEMAQPLRERLLFCDRIDLLHLRLPADPVAAIVIETSDADDHPVPPALRAWVEGNSRVPVIVWSTGTRAALREILALTAMGGDIRLVLQRRDDLAVVLDRLLASRSPPHPGAVPALLRGVVLAMPDAIQPELTLAAYHAWPRPSVHAWAAAMQMTRQALNARLGAAGCVAAGAVMDSFSAAEIAMRCTLGRRLKDITAEMGRLDDRSLRRRLGRLGCRPDQFRDEAEFRNLIGRIVRAVKR